MEWAAGVFSSPNAPAGADRTPPAEIDPTVAFGRLQRRAADRASARASVKGDEDKPGNVLARSPASRKTLLYLAVSPSSPKQAGGLAPRQPAFAGRRGGREHDLDDSRAQTFPAVIINRCPKIFELAPGGAVSSAVTDVCPANLPADIR